MMIVIKGGVNPGFLNGEPLSITRNENKIVISMRNNNLHFEHSFEVTPINERYRILGILSETVAKNPDIVYIVFEEHETVPLVNWEMRKSSLDEPNRVGHLPSRAVLYDAVARSLNQNKLNLITSAELGRKSSDIFDVERLRAFVYDLRVHLKEGMEEKEPG